MIAVDRWKKPWQDYTFVAVDIETSGAYPVFHEIVEIGAIKWSLGQGEKVFHSLVKPTRPLSPQITKIHGITNEMVQGAPAIESVVPEFLNFLADAVFVAHHAPFDAGFIMHEVERLSHPSPGGPILCSSLLSRALVLEVGSHRLQNLVQHFGLQQGTAHRALDDARACLGVVLKCFERLAAGATLEDALNRQKKKLSWERYFILRSGDQVLKKVADAIQRRKEIDLIYKGGTLKGVTRRITPIGLVRNPDGDFISAICHVDRSKKRFYLNRVAELEIVESPTQLELFAVADSLVENPKPEGVRQDGNK